MDASLNVLAKIFAHRVINGMSDDIHRNAKLVEALHIQFINWPDIHERSRMPVWRVDVMSVTDGKPNHMHNLLYCVSADFSAGAAKKVSELLEIPFKSTGKRGVYACAGYLVQVSTWDGTAYGRSKFEIL